MAYNRNTLQRSGAPWLEIKTIKGHQYLYRRWVETNGGTLIRRSEYLGRAAKSRSSSSSTPAPAKARRRARAAA
jgi:hypothetical protein